MKQSERTESMMRSVEPDAIGIGPTGIGSGSASPARRPPDTLTTG
jgi:hypothetical protein